MEEKKFIAFGGGVNSVATTILLFSRGEFYPIVFADTMAEHPYTYEYMDYFENTFLAKFGVRIIKLNPYFTPYYYRKQIRRTALGTYLIKKKLIPLATQRFCTKDWKVTPCQRWATDHGYNKTILSFAYDERERAIQGQCYPLVYEKITRDRCITIIQQAGLRVPKKSGCYFCIFKQMSAWRETYYIYPELYNKAMLIEEAFIKKSKEVGRQGHTLMHSQIPLRSYAKLLRDKNPPTIPDPELSELIPCQCMY